jgi:hypothetical protein
VDHSCIWQRVLSRSIDSETQKWGKVIKFAGIKPE